MTESNNDNKIGREKCIYKIILSLSQDAYCEDLEECKWIAAIVASGVDDVIYLDSNLFAWHCKLLRLHPKSILNLFRLYKRYKSCK